MAKIIKSISKNKVIKGEIKMDFEGFLEYLKNNKEINYNLLNEKNFRCVNYFLYRIKTAFDSYSKESNDANKIWFNNKLKAFIEDKDIRNCAGILGELQIYGLLSNSPFKQGLKCVKTNKNATPDFIYETTVDCKKIKVNIEVASSLGTDDEKKRITEQGEIFNHGKPEREGIDNSLSEVISMMNRIKNRDSQMKKEDINILAINLVNPIGEPIFLNLLKERYKPYFICKEGDNNTILTGGIWQSFYCKKGDRIFVSIGSMNDFIKEEVYEMEYDSRFQRKSIIDFAILNTYEGVVIYQNFNRNIEIPKYIYKCLMSLDNINIDNLWLNYPIKNLEKRVNYHRELGELYLREAEESKSYV